MSQIYKRTGWVFHIIAPMPPILLLSALVLMADSVHAQPATPAGGAKADAQAQATAADLAFVAGCWRLEGQGRVTDEHWLAPAGGTLLGVSRTVAGGKTVEFEFLQIRETPQGLAYIARPSGQPEATFLLASRTADEAVFENPAHDFPQRIRYRLAAADTLQARIEGTMNGKSRGVDFPYKRVACTP